MEHVVYLDSRAEEFDKIVQEKKRMVIRGASKRFIPYGKVFEGDKLYFINDSEPDCIVAEAEVVRVINTENLSGSGLSAVVENNMEKLNLTSKQIERYGTKRFIVIVEFDNFKVIDVIKFSYNREEEKADWVIVDSVK